MLTGNRISFKLLSNVYFVIFDIWCNYCVITSYTPPPQRHLSLFMSFLCVAVSLFIFFICCDYEEAAVIHRQLHNSVCACLSQHKTDGKRNTKKVQRTQMEKLFCLFELDLSIFLHFLCLLVFSFCLILPSPRPVPPPHPVHLSSPSLQYMQSYWAVKCEKLQHAWQFIILSNFPGPDSMPQAESEREKQTVRDIQG